MTSNIMASRHELSQKKQAMQAYSQAWYLLHKHTKPWFMFLFQFKNWNQAQIINLLNLPPTYWNILEPNHLTKENVIQLSTCHIIAMPLATIVQSEFKQVSIRICSVNLNWLQGITCVPSSQRWREENYWVLHHRRHWAGGQRNHADWFSKDRWWQSYPTQLRYRHRPHSCQWPCSWLGGLPPSLTISHS